MDKMDKRRTITRMIIIETRIYNRERESWLGLSEQVRKRNLTFTRDGVNHLSLLT
jgi:hypothetical protein